jgi:hypothetical protein
MDSVLAGGLIGIGGTLLGVGTQEGLASLRERRRKQRQLLQAMTAVTSELISTVSILNTALERQAWWPEGDEPLSDEWKRNREVLTDALDYELIVRTSIVYESVRSLAATRSSPLSPVSRGRLRRLLRDDPGGRSFFSLIWTNDRWPWAAAEVEQTRHDIGVLLAEGLGPVHTRLLATANRHWLRRTTDRCLARVRYGKPERKRWRRDPRPLTGRTDQGG